MPGSKKSSKTLVGEIADDVLSFTVGKDCELDAVLCEADCIGTAAHVTMLAAMPLDRPVITANERAKVIRELVGIMRKSRKGLFRIRTSDQDVHLAVERALTKALGDAGRKVHTGRSRNDQVAVDLRLYAKEHLFGLTTEAIALAKTLLALARRHESVPMVGRTHQQPAMPSSVGVWASAYAESLLEDLVVVKAAYDLNNRCPLGFAAGYGVPLPIDRRATSELLGFSAPIHNVMYASNARGKCESVILSALAQVMATLSRMARDLILFSMPEFGYFSLPPELCTGSSIMPQKKNPDVLELIRAKAVRVQGDASSVLAIVAGIPGGYSRDLQEVKEPFLAGLQTTRSSLRIAEALVSRLQVNKKALLQGFVPSVFAADRALELVAEGMPFRDAYEYVRQHLDELDVRDPRAAVAAKAHEGAPAGLDLAGLLARTREAGRFVRTEQRHYHGRVSRLLGVGYPELD